jgi:hypothetical protein
MAAEKFKPAAMYGITRNHKGWLVDLKRERVEFSKHFSDVTLPGEEAALIRAQALVQCRDRWPAHGLQERLHRDIGTVALAQRYIVVDDPKIKLASYAAPVREAIAAGKLLTGMTRDQVLMAVGYPVSTENPDLQARVCASGSIAGPSSTSTLTRPGTRNWFASQRPWLA